MAVSTRFNPMFRCEDGHVWRTTARHIVDSPALELPRCQCGAQLKMLSILGGLSEDFRLESEGGEVGFDPAIAANINQNPEKEAERLMRESVSDWRIAGR